MYSEQEKVANIAALQLQATHPTPRTGFNQEAHNKTAYKKFSKLW